MKYVIGSGWYSADEFGGTGHRLGHSYTRSPAFHTIWRTLLFRYSTPERVVIVNSDSPVRPDADPREEWICLDRNYQRSTHTHNGWTRGFLMGAWYAWNCDADFIYVEQDCVVLGDTWVDLIYEKARNCPGQFLAGATTWAGARVPWKLQQSLIFVPHNLIPAVIYGISQSQKRYTEEQMAECGVPFDFLPFGFGRIRPIAWDDSVLYLQHMDENDLKALADREGLDGQIANDLQKYD